MIATLARLMTLTTALVFPELAFAQGAPAAPPPGNGDGKGELARVREACRADVERLCKGVEPGGGRIRECLRAHREELSDGCKAAIKEARAHHHGRE
jgi:hypothetical protein